MKRDNNTNNLYFSPPSPNLVFNANQHRSIPRESLPITQFLPPNQNEYQNRYSNNIDTNNSNNAFAHLRHEISNLRSQFTKLIQKDSINNQKSKEDKLNLSSNKRDERVTAQSTIGFYGNQIQSKGDFKIENKGQTSYFRNKLALNDRKNSIENSQVQKNKKEQVNRYHKKYSFQINQKRQQNLAIQVIDSTKIQELQVQIRKLGELKHKSQEQSLHLKKQLTRIQKELENKVHILQSQNQKLKNQIEQIKISLSLKNSLVQKLQHENENYRKQIMMGQAHKGKLQNQLQMYKAQMQKIGINQKSELDKMRNRYDHQIEGLQNIHLNNINEILQRLKHSQESQRNAQLVLLQKEDQYRDLKRQYEKHQSKINVQNSLVETLQYSIKELKIQNEQTSHNYAALRIKYQELLQQNSNSNRQQMDSSKMKAIQEESIDLRKRVQSYKKTVEQLNGSNNSSRQKLIVCRQQNKKTKEQAKFLSQQLQVKQKLITSLYRDINILDSQIRHNAHLKSILSSNLRFIQQLNLKIIQLQCSRANQRYKYIDLQSTQQSS